MTENPKRVEIMSVLREYADPDGRIALPIFDQDGKRIGIARRTPEEMTCGEAHVDERGTAWMPPTAWAYMQVCRARDEAINNAPSLLEALQELLDAIANADRCDEAPVDRAFGKAQRAIALSQGIVFSAPVKP